MHSPGPSNPGARPNWLQPLLLPLARYKLSAINQALHCEPTENASTVGDKTAVRCCRVCLALQQVEPQNLGQNRWLNRG